MTPHDILLSISLRTQTFRFSPAGLVSAASTFTPKNFAAVKHFRGPGPSLLRYMEGRKGPAAAFTAAAVGAAEATGGDPAGAADLALLAAAFLAAFSAFLAAVLLGPADDVGVPSCNRQR